MKRGASEYPNDAAQIARLVRQADDLTAIRLMQVWGAKQRDIGGIKALEAFGEKINAQA